MPTVDESLKILGIEDAEIGIATVKHNYRRVIRKWHPDKFQLPEDIRKATERSKKINAAYEVLTEHIEEYGNVYSSTLHTSASEFWSTEPRHRYGNQTFTPGFPDETVFEVFLKSSNIISAGYNFVAGTLYIKFTSNAVYEYTNVPNSLWQDFIKAESHGKFAHRKIYGHFGYRSCDEPNKPYSSKSTIARNSTAGLFKISGL